MMQLQAAGSGYGENEDQHWWDNNSAMSKKFRPRMHVYPHVYYVLDTTVEKVVWRLQQSSSRKSRLTGQFAE